MGDTNDKEFNNSIGSFVQSSILPFLRSNNINFFEFSADTDDWYPLIFAALKDKKIEESIQFVYKNNGKMIEKNDIVEPFYPILILSSSSTLF